MKRFEKTVVGLLFVSILLQPLGLISVVHAETVNMEYTDPDHLHAPKEVSVCSSAIDCAPVTYEYDANGNLVSDGEREIEWNQDNKPIRITREVDGETQVVEFFYDASGRRILKRSFLESDPSDVDTTTYVSSAYQKSVVDGVETTTKYYFANGRRIAVRNAIAGEDELTFLHQDHLGSTILATDSDSQPTSNSLSYFPYGNHLTIQPFSHSSYLFTGQESDPESDLYNYNARLYNPTTGVFISADSIGGGNRYAYAANNPMMYTDPTGHLEEAGGGGRPYLPMIMKNYERRPWRDPLENPYGVVYHGVTGKGIVVGTLVSVVVPESMIAAPLILLTGDIGGELTEKNVNNPAFLEYREKVYSQTNFKAENDLEFITSLTEAIYLNTTYNRKVMAAFRAGEDPASALSFWSLFQDNLPKTIVEGKGVCRHFAIIGNYFLGQQGFESEVVTYNRSHVVVRVYIDEIPYLADLTTGLVIPQGSQDVTVLGDLYDWNMEDWMAGKSGVDMWAELMAGPDLGFFDEQ